jgi:hypothetical protein
MGRPTDWTPLGLSTDPVPGDPEQVSQEAAHLSRVATTLTAEIAALHKIANGGADGALTGQYADKIRSAAADLAGQLGKVVGRYQRVSSALSQWAPDLEQAQAQSVAALDAAEGPSRILHAKPDFPSGGKLTPAQQQDKQSYDKSMRTAQSELDAAKAMLGKAISFRDERASHYTSVIKSAIDDDVRDSFWDKAAGTWEEFTHFIGEYAWLIKDICTVLEVIGTALAIVALFATGIGWLLLAAFILTGLALAGRFLLAATGNGSWLDVAMDAFALLTLGIGGGISGAAGIVGRAAKTVDEAVSVGDTLAAAERTTSLSGRAANFFSKIADFTGSKWYVPDSVGKPFAALAKLTGDFNETLRPLASTAVKAVDKTTAWDRIFNTGEEPAKLAQKMNMLVARFPKSPEIDQLAGKLNGQLWRLRGVVGAGTAASSAGMALNGVMPVFGPDGWSWSPYHVAFWDKYENETAVNLPKIVDSARTDLRGFTPTASRW